MKLNEVKVSSLEKTFEVYGYFMFPTKKDNGKDLGDLTGYYFLDLLIFMVVGFICFIPILYFACGLCMGAILLGCIVLSMFNGCFDSSMISIKLLLVSFPFYHYLFILIKDRLWT